MIQQNCPCQSSQRSDRMLNSIIRQKYKVNVIQFEKIFEVVAIMTVFIMEINADDNKLNK